MPLVLNSSSITGLTSGGLYAPGHVIQAITATKTDTFSTNLTTFTDITGLSLSITPSSTSSRILIMYQIVSGVDTAAHAIDFQLLRNSTAIFIADAAGSRPQTTNLNALTNAYGIMASSGSYIDSPATTSAITYKFQMMCTGGGANYGYINRGVNDRNTSLYDPRGASSIIAMEIAG